MNTYRRGDKMKKDQDKSVNINIFASQVNAAYDSSTINATQDNMETGEKDEINENEKLIKKVQNLIKRAEYEEAKVLLFELESNNMSGDEAFFGNLYLGKCYIYLAQDLQENKKKSYLQEGVSCLEDAKKNWQDQKEEYVYDLYFLYINACIQLGELERRIDYYKMGIELYEKGILKTKIKDINDPKRYRLYLDYALLLDKASHYSKRNEAKRYLVEESKCYFVIGALEEVMDQGIDEESAYRYFVNAGRCFEQLLEFSEEDFEQLADSVIEFYNNALDSRLASLNSYPDRYGLVYNNLGNIYSRLISRGKTNVSFEMAANCYDKALKAYEHVNDKVKYYECLSNKARLLLSSYKKNGTKKDFEEIKDLLKSIIKKRKKIGDIEGVYFSKLQLAQLYVYGGNKNKDIDMLKKSISIYNDTLEFYTREYTPDLYYKTLYGKHSASCYLADVQKDIRVVEISLEELLEFLVKNKDDLTDYIVLLYASLVKKLFFVCVNCNGYDKDKLEELYSRIKIVFCELNLNIENYIRKG